MYMLAVRTVRASFIDGTHGRQAAPGGTGTVRVDGWSEADTSQACVIVLA